MSGSNALKKVEQSFFCPPEVSDVEAWRSAAKAIPYDDNGGNFRGQTSDKEWRARMLDNRWFCDKLQSNLEPWQESELLSTDDFAVGVFSGENLFFTAGLATHETWLRRFRHHGIFASTSYPPLDVVGLSDKYSFEEYDGKGVEWLDFWNRNIQLVQLYGLKELYHMYPDRKWYQVVGTDNYIHPDYTVKMLENLDPEGDHWVAYAWWPDGDGFPAGFDTTAWPDWKPDKMHKSGNDTFHWSSGAVGWFLSRSVMKAYADNLERFMKDPALDHNCHCPDRYTGMLLSLLGYEVTLLPDWSNSIAPASLSGVHAMHSTRAQEFLIYHYVPPIQMLSIDQRATHEMLDRVINSGNVTLLVQRQREFIDRHYDSLRSMFIAVKHALINDLPEQAKQKQRLYDLEWFN